MTLVVDASLVVAGLVDDSEIGRWAAGLLQEHRLVAPSLMSFEVANILRRVALRGEITDDVAGLAHADLLDLSVELVDHHAIAERIWQLRASVTAYDAAYVAVAEGMELPVATLDLRLARAPGPQCAFVTPPSVTP